LHVASNISFVSVILFNLIYYIIRSYSYLICKRGRAGVVLVLLLTLIIVLSTFFALSCRSAK
jgi:hypothetical protein